MHGSNTWKSADEQEKRVPQSRSDFSTTLASVPTVSEKAGVMRNIGLLAFVVLTARNVSIIRLRSRETRCCSFASRRAPGKSRA